MAIIFCPRCGGSGRRPSNFFWDLGCTLCYGKGIVDIDPSQAYFWTPEWQAGEREVDEHIARGEYQEFDSVAGFLESLDGARD